MHVNTLYIYIVYSCDDRKLKYTSLHIHIIRRLLCYTVVIRTKTVVSAVFRVVLHGSTAKVVKNSSKVGLGDVDLMKCMYGSSVT